MHRSLTSFLLIYSILLVSLTLPAAAQPNERPSQEAVVPKQQEIDSVGLKKTIAREDAKFRAESATYDPVKAEKEARKQTAKKGWSRNDKLLLAGLIVAVAAIVFFVVKYGKECVRSSPAGCTPGVDEYCVCEEYEQNP